MVFRPYLFRQGSGKAGGELVPIWLPFYGQQLHVVLKAGEICWVEHDPFPIAVGFGFVVSSADGLGESSPDPFEFGSLRRSKDDQEAEAIWLGI